MGMTRKLFNFIFNFTLVFLIISLSPGLPPKTTFPFEEFSIDVKPKALDGVLAPNTLLENPEKWLKGKLIGPEHLVEKNGAIYASLTNGQLVKIEDGEKITVMGIFGTPWMNMKNLHAGRPLGFVFDNDDETLIVMDSSNGIYELNTKSGERKLIVSTTTEIESGRKDQPARRALVFNSVAVAKNGDLYFTDSSSDGEVCKVTAIFFRNPSGRLIHLERKTGKLTTLIDELFFANGVVISPKEDFVLVSDLGRSRILKYWIKTGKTEVFADGLPGLPDNLSCDDKGVWAAIPISADPENPFLIHSMSRLPLLRKFISRLLSLFELLFASIDQVYPHEMFKTAAHYIGSGKMSQEIKPNRATIMRFDWNGNIIAVYHSFDKATYTHVLDYNGKLYLGSFSQDYIAVVARQKHL